MENNLPTGWVECSIGEILISKKGKKPASVIEEPRPGYVPYILIDEMEGKPIRCYTNDPKVSIIDERDVLLVWDGSIGKCGSGLSGAIGSTLVGLKALGNIQTKFLEYTIRQQNNFIKETSTGTGLQHINKDFFEICRIPLPPLAEQQRIVAKLDALFEKIESNKKRLDKIPVILKRFRQSVLTAAVSGRLTEDWRERNQKNVDTGILLIEKLNKARMVLFQNHCEEAKRKGLRKPQMPRGLNSEYSFEVLEPFDIPVSWQWTVLDKISTIALGGTPSRTNPSYWNGSIKWVSSGEVANNLINDTAEKITEVGLENSNAKIYPKGTVLLAMIGEGKTRGQVSILNVASTTNQNVAGIILDNNFICSEFVWYFLLSRYESLRNDGLGGAQPALNGERVGQLPIAIPSFEEQKEIVRLVEKLFHFADKLEARYNKAKAMLDKVPQSILAKAFRGELVSQNPDDEPASVLLERIKEEKEKLKPVKKKKQK